MESQDLYIRRLSTTADPHSVVSDISTSHVVDVFKSHNI